MLFICDNNNRNQTIIRSLISSLDDDNEDQASSAQKQKDENEGTKRGEDAPENKNSDNGKVEAVGKVEAKVENPNQDSTKESKREGMLCNCLFRFVLVIVTRFR